MYVWRLRSCTKDEGPDAVLSYRVSFCCVQGKGSGCESEKPSDGRPEIDGKERNGSSGALML